MNRISPLALFALLLVGCGTGEVPDPGNASLERSVGSRLHAGPTPPKGDGVRATP